MFGVDRTDLDVIAVLDQDLGQGEGETVYLVYVSLDEQHATRLVGDGRTIGECRSGTHAEQHGLLVVISRGSPELAEDHLPLVGALIVDSVERLVEDRLDDRTEVCTAHWDGH